VSLSPGVKLGAYEITEPLGAGGMGEVYRARDSKLGRMVALKVLPAHLSRDQDALARFEREAKALGALQHPNVLGIYDFGTQDGIAYAVMELLEGETLRGVIARGPVPERRALAIGAQIAEGLAAAHAKGIVHRDLKPENVFVLKDGRVKLLDFGLAKVTPLSEAETSEFDAGDVATDAGVVMGTVGYMAPEQVRGAAVDARADIFALGCVLYELVTGQRAFSRPSAVETLNAILKDQPDGIDEDTAQLPPALGRFLGHCLDKDPERRFQSAQDVAFALGSSVSTNMQPVVREAPGAPPRHRLALRGTVAAAALMCAFVLGWSLRRPPVEASPALFDRIGSTEGVVWGARFAPDGRSVLYSSLVGETSRLSEFNLARREDRPFPAVPVGEILAVAPDGDLAVLQEPRIAGPLTFGREGTLARAALGGGAPRAVAEHVRYAEFGPGGRDLILVREGPDGGSIEWPAGKVVFRTTGFISHPRLASDGHRLAFLHHHIPNDTQGRVAILDLRTGQSTDIGPQWTAVWGLSWHPNGEIWVTGAEKVALRWVHAVRPDGHSRLVLSLPQGGTIHDITASGQVLMDAMAGVRGVFIPGADAAFRELGTSPRSVLADLSRDGDSVLFTDRERAPGPDYPLFLRPTDGGPPLSLGLAQAGRLSPDGRYVALWAGGEPRELQLVPTRLGDKRTLALTLQPGEVFRGVQWLPDSSSLFLSTRMRGGTGRLYRLQVATGAQTAMNVPDLGNVSQIQISADGRHVVAPSAAGSWRRYRVESAAAVPLESFDVPANLRVIGCEAECRVLHLAEGGFKTLPLRLLRLAPGGKPEHWQLLSGPDRARVEDVRESAAGAFAIGYFRMEGTLHVVDGLR
jgi:eukaryotic-like serine/threonine-protein kinase